MLTIKGLSLGCVVAGFAALAALACAGEASPSANQTKVENPDAELVVTITPVTDNPFSPEHPAVFRKGEAIPVTVSWGNSETEHSVPMRRGGKSWYDFVEFSIRITDMNDRLVSVKGPLLVATLDKREARTGDSLPANSGVSATWNLMIPEGLEIKEDQVKITVECRLRASGLGLIMPEGSGKVVHSNAFMYRTKLAPIDAAVVRYRKAVGLALNGDPKAALPDLEALVAQYPDNLKILAMLAATYEMAGDKAKAIAVYQQWIEKQRRSLHNLPEGLRSGAEEAIAHISAKVAKLKQQGNAGGQ